MLDRAEPGRAPLSGRHPGGGDSPARRLLRWGEPGRAVRRRAVTDPFRRRRRAGDVFSITRAGRPLSTWASPAQVCVHRGLRA